MRDILANKISWIVFGCLLVIGLLIAAAFVALRQGKSPSGVADSATHISGTATTDIVTSTETIPIYPNSIIASEHCPHVEVNDCRQELHANASITDVVRYYKTRLENAGWVISKEMQWTQPRSTDRSWSAELILTNTVGITPMRRWLSIGVDYSLDRPDFQSWVTLEWQRWPDPFKVPIYPSAENVQSRWEQHIDQTSPCGDLKRITAFTTSAPLDDVGQYYRTIMLLKGWSMIPPEGARFIPVFVYSRGGPDEPERTYSHIVLSLKPDPDNKALTQVELQIVGSDLIQYCLDRAGNLGS